MFDFLKDKIDVIVGIIFSLMSCCTDGQDQWTQFGSNSDLKLDFYLQVESDEDSAFADVKILYNFSEFTYGMDTKHKSEIEKARIDCEQKKFFLRDVNWYFNDMGKGKIVFNIFNLEWMDIEDDTVMHRVAKISCHNYLTKKDAALHIKDNI